MEEIHCWALPHLRRLTQNPYTTKNHRKAFLQNHKADSLVKKLLVLLELGLSENRVYSQWNSHLIGIMISKTIGFRGTQHFQTHPTVLSVHTTISVASQNLVQRESEKSANWSPSCSCCGLPSPAPDNTAVLSTKWSSRLNMSQQNNIPFLPHCFHCSNLPRATLRHALVWWIEAVASLVSGMLCQDYMESMKMLTEPPLHGKSLHFLSTSLWDPKNIIKWLEERLSLSLQDWLRLVTPCHASVTASTQVTKQEQLWKQIEKCL